MIITLTSDLGMRDHYVASVKAALLTLAPDVSIVDISHQVRPFDIHEAAFLVRSVWQQFPIGTVHIIGINPEYNTQQIHVAVHYMGHYFVCADNGMFSLLFDEVPQDIFELTLTHDADFNFPMRGAFATAAAHLCKGGSPEFLGKRISALKQTPPKLPQTEHDLIKGHVQYIDHYGNVYTNITRQIFDAVSASRSFAIHFKKAGYAISTISHYFHDVIEGERLAMWAHNDCLMLAINGGAPDNGGGAADLFGLKKDDIIRIEFHGNPHSENDIQE
ncbi:MAG: S-adenosyl-l-methionine hydroxide adenosyltransferase family protein [Flavobacteriales bacterium]